MFFDSLMHNTPSIHWQTTQEEQKALQNTYFAYLTSSQWEDFWFNLAQIPKLLIHTGDKIYPLAY